MAEIKEAMKLGRYFMNLEDKYWGLFLLALAVLFFLMGKKHRAYLGYGILSYLFLICPVTVFLTVKSFPALSLYYPLRWLCQMPVFICAAFVFVLDKVKRDQGIKKTLAAAAFLCFMLLLAGTPAFLEENRPWTDSCGLKEEYVEVSGLLLSDMEKRNLEKAYVWGPKEWMESCRIYSADFYPIYGKDLWDEQAARGYDVSYSDAQRTLYEFYSTYESVKGPLSNKWQQVEVLADTLNASGDVVCDYVIMHKGTEHWKKRGSKVKRLNNVDVEGAFVSRNYEPAGSTEHYYVFYKSGR